ncbi:MAG: hypothetical protein NC339_06985 [Muribaculaceae bacterium]|nr:hypothetical protein [Muribaculaceae bacterium]
MKSFIFPALIVGMMALLTASCSRLSSEAKEIVGSYYNPELSQNEPVMELRSDGTCLVRAIRPGVLTYSVEGQWNVRNDSLVMELDSNTLKTDGDPHLVGKIPTTYSSKIIDHSDFNLQLEQGGATYLYQRHNH